MKVYTKTGDKGTTGLFGGARLPKYHMQIEAYGTVDELNSHIGLLRDQEMEEDMRKQLLRIQDRLFTLGSHLAADPDKKEKLKLPPVLEKDIEDLENWVDKMDEVLPEMRSFVLPGGHSTVSYCHISRCVCRRAERLVVHLSENIELDVIYMKYLNRLSDYLFVLARKLTQDLDVKEVPWTPEY